jgi:hypothetical protein
MVVGLRQGAGAVMGVGWVVEVVVVAQEEVKAAMAVAAMAEREVGAMGVCSCSTAAGSPAHTGGSMVGG